MKSTVLSSRTSLLVLPMIVAAGMASAGGLSQPVQAPAPVAVVTPAPVSTGTDWTGFYVGGQLGFGQIESDGITDDEDGAIFGVHAGYLYDFGNFVLGGELDYDATNIEGEGVVATIGELEVDSVARLKLIAGYDAGVWMPYATAGLARTQIDAEGISGEVEEDGRFAGLGVSYRLNDSFRVGGEVLRHQFEDFDDGEDVDATTASLRVSFQF